MTESPSPETIRAARQQQFLEVVDRDTAEQRFHAHLDLGPLGLETSPLDAVLGRILATDITSDIDVPGFDRSNVDGFAVQASDTFGAMEEQPRQLALNDEVLAPGVRAVKEVNSGSATTIATGAVVPRGADAVVIPVNPMNRAAELEHYIADTGSRVCLAGQELAGFILPMLDSTDLEQVVVASYNTYINKDTDLDLPAEVAAPAWSKDVPGVVSWEQALAGNHKPAEHTAGPDDLAVIPYSSGTTGAPKGVLHTGNTLLAAARSCIAHLNLTAEEVILMASPLAHQTGFVYGLVLPLVLGARSVLQEIWSPRIAAQWIEDESVSFTMAATPFLADMAQSSELEGFNFSSFRTFVSAGAPIPRVIARQAADRLGAHIASGWGMTENSLVTTTRREDPEEKVFETDGLAHEGMEVRIRDDTGGLAGVGVEGWLESRGAAQFVGYLKKPDLAGFDVEGWFETGDLATMDADGYIRITGRTKDVIIRGGENIPVVEVEELLYQHPHVSAAAIVGMPDERLGERACCFLILSAGMTLTFEEMVEYLLSKGLSKTYLPERLEIVSEMPRTASGKIQKFHLRETLQR